MSSNDGTTPDLASVLSILAGLTPQTQQPITQPTPTPNIPAQAPQFPPQQIWQQTAQYPLRSSTPTDPPPNAPKLVDPATIIEWSSGLRCVMKTVAKHEGMLHEIRRMIQNQHDHEELWFKGREALVEKQRARKDGQKKLDDVLKLVGGTVTDGTSNTSPEEMAKELETFDMKVYRAQTQMVKEMVTKLRGLGVPFFGTRSNLVRVPGKEVLGGEVNDVTDGKGMIDEAELIRLQRQMLVILEDLCSD